MNTLKLILFTFLSTSSTRAAERFKEEDVPWKNASPETCVCLDDANDSAATSFIRVTSIDGEIASIYAHSDNVAKGKSWNCHFKKGRIVSAVFRRYRLILIPTGEGTFRGEPDYDRIEVFHFPEHELIGLEPTLKNELSRIIAIATDRGEQGGAEKPATGSESRSKGREKSKAESERRSQ